MSKASLKDMRAKAAVLPSRDVPPRALDNPTKLGAFGPQFAPSFANEEVKRAWWRQHVDSVAVTRARTSEELAKAREQAKLSVETFCLVLEESVPGAAAIPDSTPSDVVAEPVVATCVATAPAPVVAISKP